MLRKPYFGRNTCEYVWMLKTCLDVILIAVKAEVIIISYMYIVFVYERQRGQTECFASSVFIVFARQNLDYSIGQLCQSYISTVYEPWFSTRILTLVKIWKMTSTSTKMAINDK